MSDSTSEPNVPAAEVRKRGPFSFIWILPLVALAIGGYLAFTTLSQRGPDIVITFKGADGLTAGQTKVRHKNVDLGTVAGIRLAEDMNHVIVTVHMTAEAAPYLTDQARFWVVRPRLSGSNISGLETLISGGYIELDPGDKTAKSQRQYTGLEDPPGVRSDEPGRTFVLQADRIGSIGSGSPVFYRDIVVGEVLGYHLPEGSGPIPVNIFVREPYDKWIRKSTSFWNASGVRVELGGAGVHVQVESLQAVLSGGVAFGTSEEQRDEPMAAQDTTFPLYKDEGAANAAGYKQRIPLVAYFKNSAAGLAVDSPVQIFGIQIGTVTAIDLKIDAGNATPQVRVAMEMQPERLAGVGSMVPETPEAAAQRLVDLGMRAELVTSSYITSSKAVSLEFLPNMPHEQIGHEGKAIVLPTQGGGLDSITTALSDVAQKVDAIPFAQIGASANTLIKSLADLVGGAEMKRTLTAVSGAMVDVQGLVKRTDAGLTPLLKRLPEMSNDLEQTLNRANHLVGSVDTGYGNNSQFSRDLERMMAQLNDTARSIRLLADFLDRHPEALIRGRTNQGAER